MSKAASFAESWLNHRLITLKLLGQIKDEHLSYRPWEKALTLQELALHIFTSANFFINTVKAGAISPRQEEPIVKTAEELRALAHELTEKSRTTLSSLPDETFTALVDMTQLIGKNVPGEAVLQLMRDHEIHHKGQLFTYVRSVGVETVPPFTKL